MKADKENVNTGGDNANQDAMGDTDPNNISLEEIEMNKVIDAIVGNYSDNDNIKASLIELKAWYMCVSLPRYKNTLASLNSLVSLIGGQDGRIIQLLNHINSGLV